VSASTTQTLPYKRCGCGRVYSHKQWSELPMRGYQLASSEILEMRNCACKSTITVTLSPEQYLHSLAACATDKSASDVERQLAGSILADAVLRLVRVGTLPEGQTPEDEQWLTEEIEMDDFLERERDRAEDAAFDADREEAYP
jgi:hypothetical protein